MQFTHLDIVMYLYSATLLFHQTPVTCVPYIYTMHLHSSCKCGGSGDCSSGIIVFITIDVVNIVVVNYPRWQR